MFRWVLVLLLAIASFTGSAQGNLPDLTLKDFKKGIFTYENGQYEGAKITRTKKWQIEEYPNLNLKIKFRIDWVADFEYHLTFEKVSDPVSECLIGDVIKVKVLSIEDDMFNVLVQNGRKFEKIKIRMLDMDPKNQENFFWVVNSMKY